MSIVTISRGSYSRGKEVAERLAEKMNFECVSRDIILETCKEFNLPEIKLVRALHDAPSVLERFKHGRERFLSYFNYALLKHVQQRNVVYHGLAGHFILKEIPHVLKIRVVADMELRVKEEMERENISSSEALYLLKKDDDERRKWGLHVHGADPWDSRLYDMVFHIGQLSVDDVVDMIANTLNKESFKPTPESMKKLDEMVFAAKIHTIMVRTSPHAKVSVANGDVVITNAGDSVKSNEAVRSTVEKTISELEGVNSLTFADPLSATGNYINPYHNI